MASERNDKGFYPGDVPAKPGVYVFRDAFGTVIYVGKAANLRKRVSQYFQPSRRRTADPKTRSLIHSIHSWEFHVVKNEDEAMVLESRFIKQHAPKYNALLRDDKRFQMVKINLNERFPRLILARLRKDDGCRYFGPFPKGTALRETVRFITRRFGIRSCRGAAPDAEDHKHCLASVVKDCCAPCVGAIDENGYREKVDAMMNVLEGDVSGLVEEAREEMERRAAAKQFEKAALARDMITNLREIFGARNRNFRYAAITRDVGVDGLNDLRQALGLADLPSRVEGFDISNIAGQHAVASMVSFIDGKPNRGAYRRFKIKNVAGIDDVAMIGEVVERRYGRLLREERELPDLIMIDGGKGQLNMAVKRLVAIGCPPLPVVGLAKRNEEIFIPGRAEPVRLDRRRPALRLLQAVRDEAHRFAVAYHRELRSKRIRESLIDDIPNVGPSRKKALLAAFGSVRELRKATPEEIAAKTPGIGVKFAADLLEALAK